MALLSSGEMYLETIYILRQKKGKVRAIDVAEKMGFSKPSVSRAVGILKKENYITVEPDGNIGLTEAGLAVAVKIYERHTVISNALVFLGVDEKTATEDACKIEHVISDESFAALKNHLSLYRSGT